MPMKKRYPVYVFEKKAKLPHRPEWSVEGKSYANLMENDIKTKKSKRKYFLIPKLSKNSHRDSVNADSTEDE